MRALVIANSTHAKTLRPVLKQAGLTVEVIEDLDRGDFKLETREYDLVLVDQRDARVAPLIVAWRFKGVNANIIVLLPSKSSSFDRTRCLDAGADLCLNHPIDRDELRAHLRALSRRNPPAPDPVLRIHDLEIHEGERTVRRAGRPIDLTPHEFDLLHLLAMNQGKIVTQTVILDRLFQGDGKRSSNIVTVYIRFLRKKIDEGFELPLILTRWGQGYLLRPEEDSSE